MLAQLFQQSDVLRFCLLLLVAYYGELIREEGENKSTKFTWSNNVPMSTGQSPVYSYTMRKTG
uniref:D-glycerate 3-kinase n=1 Tax=Rhizophora mucronata TaxID=61149 RepID=A0A2P2LMN7_RHIMU